MAEKKAETPGGKPPPADEAKESKESMAARLLASYQHNMEHASPRTLEELQIIKDLLSN